MESLTTPYLLLASPELPDPNFARSVVLMGHHTKDGALGWIVNRVLDKPAAELLPPPLDASVHPKTPLRLGGPVLTNGLVVVFQGEVADVEQVEMAPGIRVSASPAILPKLFAPTTDAPDGRNGHANGFLVLGYAGWGPEQLEHEMEDGSWLVAPYDASFVFTGDIEDLWERALRSLGVNPENVAAAGGGVS